MKQAHGVGIESVAFLKFETRLDLRRDLGAEMQERLSASGSADVFLQPSCHHLVQHLEKGDEVALARTVCTDQDIQSTQFEGGFLDGSIALDLDSPQHCHGSSLLDVCQGDITPARKFRILAHTNPTRQRGL